MRRIVKASFLLCGCVGVVATAHGDVLCKAARTGAVIARPTVCNKRETAIATLSTTSVTASNSAGLLIGNDITVQDNGAVGSGADSTIGLDLSVNRLNAVGGSINTTGLNVGVVGDPGGDSTNIGLSVQTGGADVNYCAIFQGGNVGINVTDPDEALEILGRFHLGQSSSPDDVADKLYNVGGTLFWSGQQVGLQSSGEGRITSVNAGPGLVGGGASGGVTIAVDAGTTAGKVVQLTQSAELPSVSGANLTALNASSISSGQLSDARLSGNVSLLGPQISLSGEVVGVLPVANGGIGASSLTDLIALGSHTSGNYVTALQAGTGVTVSPSSPSEGTTATVALDTAVIPTWSAVHSFLAGLNVGTTSASSDLLHLNGRLHLEPSSAPAVATDRLYNVAGQLFFNGQNLSSQAAGGDVTEVTAGGGLTGGGTSGAVTLSVDTGTTAGKIVQLNGSAQLPAVNGGNLTSLNASALASGEVPNTRLNGQVSLLGPSIDLASTEAFGILPLAKGGIGAGSLNDLITLGNHTTGTYVTSVTAGDGITVTPTGTESLTATVALNQSFTPTWTGTHTFSGVANDLATPSNEDFAIMPGGTGKVGLGTNSPSAFLHSSSSTNSGTATSQTGSFFQIANTGAVASGTDTTTGARVLVSRTLSTGGTVQSTGLDVDVSTDGGGAGATVATGLDVSVSGADTNYAAVFSGGNVGIGVSTPTSTLQTLASSTTTTAATTIGHLLSTTDTGIVTTGTDSVTGLSVGVTRSGATGGTINAVGLAVTVGGDNAGAGTSTAIGLDVSAASLDNIVAARFSGGSVGIGAATATLIDSNVASGSLVIGNGALCVDNLDDDCIDATRAAGSIYAESTSVSGIDLAEDFPIRIGDEVTAGDIVVAATAMGDKCIERKKNEAGTLECVKTKPGLIPFVARSTGGGHEGKRILGVVSTQPGVTLGGFGREELSLYQAVPLALAGRVPVKVSGVNGAIEVGDRITPSTIPGVGMRAEEGDASVGIALEPFTGEQGEVLVLVK